MRATASRARRIGQAQEDDVRLIHQSLALGVIFALVLVNEQQLHIGAALQPLDDLQAGGPLRPSIYTMGFMVYASSPPG